MSGARVDVISKDKGLERILAMAKRVGAEKPYAKAGIIGSKAAKQHNVKTPGGTAHLTNVELAIIHEFGAPAAGIPERSFIRSSFDKNRPKYDSMCNILVRKIYEGSMGERQALGLLGLAMATDMKLGVTQGAGIQPPNSPATLRRKLSKTRRGPPPPDGPRALVDTGQMVGAMSWEVVAGETPVAEGEAHE